MNDNKNKVCLGVKFLSALKDEVSFQPVMNTYKRTSQTYSLSTVILPEDEEKSQIFYKKVVKNYKPNQVFADNNRVRKIIYSTAVHPISSKGKKYYAENSNA